MLEDGEACHGSNPSIHDTTGDASHMKWLWLLVGAVLLALLQLWLPWPWLRTTAWITAAWLLVRLGCWLLLEWPARQGWWPEPAKILRDLGQLLAGSAITLVVLHQQAGVNLMGLVTTSAVLTAVVGLAAQQTLKDLFAGITLQLDPPFQLGDWIDLGEVSGVVESLTLMNTRLRNVEGARIAVPNATVVQTGLRCFRAEDPVGTRLQVGLDYALPPDQAVTMIKKVLTDHPRVLSTPAPRIWLQNYADSCLLYEVLVWHHDARLGVRNQIRSELRCQLWYALHREGWSVPFPVREVQPRRVQRDRQHPALCDEEQRARLLGHNPLFSNLDPGQLMTLAQRCQVLRFGAGETVLRQGDVGDALYQVVEGRLAVELHRPGQGEVRIAELRAGEVAGEMGLFAGEPRSATVRALQASLLLEVERDALTPLLEASPGLADQLAALITQRRAATEQLANDDAQTSAARRGLAERIRQVLLQLTVAGRN